ncbi:MAG: hypothetical protein RBT71_12390, partial [Flavobacteriales bacterium]|nr:hypothetical protein [Flavobacteriales bacterium]
MRDLLVPLVVLLALAGCQGPQAPALRPGPWHAVLDITGPDDEVPVHLPFRFDMAEGSEGDPVMVVRNGAEEIVAHEITVRGDTVHVRMPLYDSEFRCLRAGDSLLTGTWHNHLRGTDYVLPFSAFAGQRDRFTQAPPPGMDITGEWKTRMHAGCCDSSMALGIFTQQGSALTGTFATETGDHRFLEGVVRGDSVLLSVFNGFQANLFAARWRNDSLLGRVYWGRHGRDRWEAVQEAGFSLRNADSLTFLKEEHHMVA